jgi:protein ECT2
MSSDDPAPWEEEIIQTSRVSSRIVLTGMLASCTIVTLPDLYPPVHQMGLFEFRTGANSRPSTPTARSKVSIFGLDAISRNLFNSRPASAMGDFFGGSINGSKRSRSTTSKSSTYASTADSSLMRFSHRSGSTTATSEDDETSFFSGSRKASTRKTLLKRSVSPSPDPDKTINKHSVGSLGLSRKRSRSSSRGADTDLEYSDLDENDGTLLDHLKEFNTSDRDLAQQLALARKNSKTQGQERMKRVHPEEPVEVGILEGKLIVSFYRCIETEMCL